MNKTTATILAWCAWSIGSVMGTEEHAQPYALTPLWQTDPVLETPESVLYHPEENLLYVSNVAGHPLDKNNKGFVSKVLLDGKIETLKWAVGLHAPKGMAIHGDRLFVSDIDVLVEIDLKTGNILQKYPAAEAVFLNDVTVDNDGFIYVGDSSAENSKIYKLDSGKLEVWVQSPEIERPNGLYMMGRQLLAGQVNGRLIAIDLESKKISPIAQTDTGIDGLKPDGKGNYLTSNWSGRTSLITAGGETIVLMDTTTSKVNAADFEYLESQALLLIPTFFDNRISAYTLNGKP